MNPQILHRPPYQWELAAHPGTWMVRFQGRWDQSSGDGLADAIRASHLDGMNYLESFTAFYPFTTDPLTPATLTPPCPHWTTRQDGCCSDECAAGACPLWRFPLREGSADSIAGWWTYAFELDTRMIRHYPMICGQAHDVIHIPGIGLISVCAKLQHVEIDPLRDLDSINALARWLSDPANQRCTIRRMP